MNRLLAACLSPLLVAALLTAACGSPPPAEPEPPYRSATVEEFQSVLAKPGAPGGGGHDRLLRAVPHGAAPGGSPPP